MQKFIISVKEKHSGRDVVTPYIVNSLSGLGHYSERISPMGFIVIVDSIKEENNFVEICSENPVGSNNDFVKFGIVGNENIESDGKK